MMDGLEKNARAELSVIESVYGLRILNRDEAARLIASRLDSEAMVLRACTAINTWVSMNKKSDSITIPEEVLIKIVWAVKSMG